MRLDLLATLGASEVGDQLRSEVARLRDPAAPASLALLQARAAAATDRVHAAAILEDAVAAHTADPDTLAAYYSLWSLDDVPARVAAARRLISRRPTDAARYADALVAEGLPPARVAEALSGDRSFESALLNVRVLLAWGTWKDAHTAAQKLPSPTSPQQSLAALAAQGETAAIAADWPAAQAALVQLEAFGSLDSRLARVAILRVMQRHSDTLAVLQPALGTDADGPVADRSRIEALLRAAEASVHLQQLDQAEAMLRRAVAADPHDDRAYSGLATLLSSASLTSTSAKLTDVVRQVRENAPASRGVRGLIVQQSLSSDSSDDGPAVARLRDFIRRTPQDSSLIDQLAQVAEHGRTTGAKYPRSRAFLETLAAQRPGSAALNTGLARLLSCEGLHEKALATLTSLPPQIFERSNLIQQEQLLRDHLNRKPDADRLTAVRNEGTPPNINSATERADELWRDAQFDESVLTLSRAVAPGAELDIDQQARVLYLANRALSPIARLTEEPLSGATPEGLRALAFFDIAAIHGSRLLPTHHQARLLLTGVNASDDRARLLAAANLAGQQHPTLKVAALRLVTEAAGARLPAKGTAFLFYALEQQPESQKDTLAVLIRRVVSLGTADDVNRVLDLAERPALVASILQDFDAAPEPGASDSSMQAELAYLVASGITMSGDAARADAIYRRALARDPHHGLANNDLGYALLEKGDLSGAEPLIEAAAAALPDKPHVLDSLGWLRYRQGRILDSAAGEGALTVLKKALSHSQGDDPAMEDHLGDAMWAAGEFLQAIATWERAQATGARRLDELRAFSATREADVKETREIIKRCADKRASVLKRLEPAIAPWPGRREPGTQIIPQNAK
jgi:tetratricopeptide (TPR) repeat protein